MTEEAILHCIASRNRALLCLGPARDQVMFKLLSPMTKRWTVAAVATKLHVLTMLQRKQGQLVTLTCQTLSPAHTDPRGVLEPNAGQIHSTCHQN